MGTNVVNLNYNWSVISGTQYEIEYDTDLTGSLHTLFINGAIVAQSGGTGTRTATCTDLWVGSDRYATNGSQCSIREFSVYNTIQHTTTYVPYVISPNINATSTSTGSLIVGGGVKMPVICM